jgi:hypothetical protein
MAQPYYAMTALYPPTVVDMPHSGKRYAISGSIWIEVTPDVTQKMVQDAWTPLYVPKAPVKVSPEKHYTVESSRTGEKYTVSDHGNGDWSCSCVGFSYYKKCKHIAQTKNTK